MRFSITLKATTAAATTLVLGAALLAGTPALAASRPSVSTGAARQVSYASATLTGSVNPNGSDASYYFQYGVTRAYGAQSAIADAGAGTRKVSVSVPIAGLQPLTLYHYRLVAVNAAGATVGSDRALLTARIPLSLAILASPNPVPFGGTVTVQGTLSGTGNAGIAVALQADSFPYLQGFVNVNNAELTLPSGGFSFVVLNLTAVTQFRVVTLTTHPVVSPIALENVAVAVTSHVRRTKRAHFARIFGTVTPAQDGGKVAILRIVHGRGVLVGGTTLRHHDATSSTYSRVVPVHAGAYRVLAVPASGAQVANYGRTLLIG